MILDINLLPKKFNEVNYFKKLESGCEIYSYSKTLNERNEVLIVKLDDFEIANDFCVENKTLEMVKVLYPCDIEITEKSFIIKSKKGKYTGKLLSEDLFSLQIEDLFSTAIEADINVLIKASTYVNKNIQKPVLTGVRVDLNSNVYATDSFRAYFYVPNNKALTTEGITLPISFINNIKSIFNLENNNVKINIYKNIVYYENENITLCSKIIEGAYPDMSKIFGNYKAHETIDVDKTDLLDKISIANNVGTDNDKNTIVVLSKNKFEAFGSNNYEAEIKFENDNQFTFKLPINHLEQALKTIAESDAHFNILHKDKIGIMLFASNNEKEVCLILGIK